MKTIIDQYREYQNKQKYPKGDRDHFWASEVNKCKRAMFWTWKKEEDSNPIRVENMQIMNVGKLVEEQFVLDLCKMGIVVDPKLTTIKDEWGNEHKVFGAQRHIEIEKYGIKITGKIDAIMKTNFGETPIEVKSYFGDYQEKMLFDLKPNERYAKQLAVYMDALGVDMGVLYMINRGNGNHFQIIMKCKSKKKVREYEIEATSYVKAEPDNVDNEEYVKFFKCGILEFDMEDTYKWFAEAHKMIEAGELPEPSFTYKHPLEKLKEARTTDISKARNGRAVYGDWECKYCSYKNKCLKEQGVELGYTEKEILAIKKITEGYTSKKWKIKENL